MDRQTDTALVWLMRLWYLFQTIRYGFQTLRVKPVFGLSPAYQSLDGESRKDKKSCGKICTNKDHKNNYQPTAMSEYARHHNVKSWGRSKTLIKLHSSTASSEFDPNTQIPVHKA